MNYSKGGSGITGQHSSCLIYKSLSRLWDSSKWLKFRLTLGVKFWSWFVKSNSADTVAISLRSLTLVYPSGKVAGHLSHKSSYTSYVWLISNFEWLADFTPVAWLLTKALLMMQRQGLCQSKVYHYHSCLRIGRTKGRSWFNTSKKVVLQTFISKCFKNHTSHEPFLDGRYSRKVALE